MAEILEELDPQYLAWLEEQKSKETIPPPIMADESLRIPPPAYTPGNVDVTAMQDYQAETPIETYPSEPKIPSDWKTPLITNMREEAMTANAAGQPVHFISDYDPNASKEEMEAIQSGKVLDRDKGFASTEYADTPPGGRPTQGQLKHAQIWEQAKPQIVEAVTKQYGVNPDKPPPKDPAGFARWKLAAGSLEKFHAQTLSEVVKQEQREYQEKREDKRDEHQSARDLRRDVVKDERDANKEDARTVRDEDKEKTRLEREKAHKTAALADYIAKTTTVKAGNKTTQIEPNNVDLVAIKAMAGELGLEYKKVNTGTKVITTGLPGVSWFDKKTETPTSEWQLVPKSGNAAPSAPPQSSHALSGQKPGRYKVGGKEIKWDGSKEM